MYLRGGLFKSFGFLLYKEIFIFVMSFGVLITICPFFLWNLILSGVIRTGLSFEVMVVKKFCIYPVNSFLGSFCNPKISTFPVNFDSKTTFLSSL